MYIQEYQITKEFQKFQLVLEFSIRWNFSNAVGSIDGKHVIRKCPVKYGTLYYNCKRFPPIVLQAIADYNCRFTFIDVSVYGKQSERGRIYCFYFVQDP